MKKTFFRVICIGLMSVMLFGITCIIGCGEVKKGTDSAGVAVLDYRDNDGEIQIKRANAILNADTGYVEETVTALLSPLPELNKGVDWVIEWADNAPLKNTDINEYLRVTPDPNDSMTAKIRCYKSFRGSSALLFVTSRNSGAKGSCVVYFVGKPNSLTVNTSGLTVGARGTQKDVYFLNNGQTYTLDIALSNIFGDVGADYKNYTVSVSGVGSFVKGTASIFPSKYEWSDEVSVTLDSVKDKYISVSIADGKLVIEAKGRYESEKGNYVGGGASGSIMANRYKQDNVGEGGYLPYYSVVVKASNIDKQIALRFYIDSSVTEVSTIPGEVSF